MEIRMGRKKLRRLKKRKKIVWKGKDEEAEKNVKREKEKEEKKIKN